jgi:hypothetical protein
MNEIPDTTISATTKRRAAMQLRWSSGLSDAADGLQSGALLYPQRTDRKTDELEQLK